MTTIACDGNTIAADSLCADPWGFKETVNKVFKGVDFCAAGAGDWHILLQWWRRAERFTFSELLMCGYPEFNKDNNDPSIIVAQKGRVYRLSGTQFLLCNRGYHAVGSGRD